MTKTTQALALMCVLLSLALLSACQSGPRPVSMLTQVKADTALTSMSDQLAAHPVVGYFRPNRTGELEAIMERVFEGVPVRKPKNVGYTDLLLSELLETEPDKLPDFKGLDSSRPILIGAGRVSSDPMMETLVYGNILDVSELPTLVQAQVILPATDTNALVGTISRWAEGQNLETKPFTGQWLKVAPDGGLIVGNRIIIAIVPQAKSVRLEIGMTDLGMQEDAIDALAQLALDKGDVFEVTTPAVNHFMEGDATFAAHVNTARWAQLSTLIGLMDMSSALRYATPEVHQMLYAAGCALVLNSARVMNIADRQFVDVTFSAQAPSDVDLRLTRTMSASAREAHALAQVERGNVYKARSAAPLAETQIGYSLRQRYASTPAPSWAGSAGKATVQDLAMMSREGGGMVTLYMLFNGPWSYLKVLESTGVDVEAALPNSASMVLERFELPTGYGMPEIVAGLVAEYPGGDLPTPVKLLGNLIKADPELSQLITYEARTGKDRSLLLLSIGKRADELFDLDNPIKPTRDIVARNNLKAVSAFFEQSGDQDLSTLTRAFESIDAVMATQEASQSLRARVSVAGSQNASGPVLPVIYPTPKGLAEKQPSKGQYCLIDMIIGYQQLFDALAHATPSARTQLLEAGYEYLKAPRQCALDDPTTKDTVTTVDNGFWFFMARGQAMGDNIPDAIKLAQRACDGGRPKACAFIENIKPPYPLDSLNVPAAPWPSYANTQAVDAVVEITNEGVYIGKERLADVARLSEGQGQTIDWLVKALKEQHNKKSDNLGVEAVEVETIDEEPAVDNQNRRPIMVGSIEIQFDANTPWAVVRRVVHTSAQAGFEALIVFKSTDNQRRRSWFYTRQPSEPHNPNEYQFYLSLDAGGIRIVDSDGAPLLLMERNPNAKDLGVDFVKLTEAVRMVRVKAPGALINVHINAETNLQNVLTLLAAFQGPMNYSAGATVEQISSVINNAYPGDLGPAPTFIFDSPQPLGGGAGLGNLGGGNKKAAGNNNPKVLPTKPVVQGSMDKAVIRRVIRSHQSAIKYCYEKELTKDPSLQGKVTISFIIKADGMVGSASVANTTLNNKAVEGCVTRVVQRMAFPTPNGGGIVKVTYPFIFSNQ